MIAIESYSAAVRERIEDDHLAEDMVSQRPNQERGNTRQAEHEEDHAEPTRAGVIVYRVTDGLPRMGPRLVRAGGGAYEVATESLLTSRTLTCLGGSLLAQGAARLSRQAARKPLTTWADWMSV